MTSIGILKEEAPHEARVAATPETVAKYISLGLKVIIEKNAGVAAGFADAAYESAGAVIGKARDADIVLGVQPAASNQALSNVIVIGLLEPTGHQTLLKQWAQNNVSAFAMEWIPRISRAQSMDVLSSQSNLAGYKAVIEAANAFHRAMPMMMTAAGTIKPAKLLVLGAGVAGLQAIATGRRLGAVVSAFDVRPAAREQVESLGASFIAVEGGAEGTGGYAKEMDEAYKQRQAALLADTIKTQDIIITTALIPGKPAPVLITKAMVESMKPGSVIVDLAAQNGGNCELTEKGKIVEKHGITIIGHENMPSRLAADSSSLYARNLLQFVQLIYKKEPGQIEINLEDDIIKGCLVTHKGEMVHPLFKKEAA